MDTQDTTIATVDTGEQAEVFDFSNATLEQFEDRITHDSEFRQEYLDNEKDEKYKRFDTLAALRETGQYTVGQGLDTDKNDDTDTSGGNGGQPDQTTQDNKSVGDGTTSTEESTTEDDNVTITLSKSLLGTYLKGREEPEAVVEMLKGKQKADEMIKTLVTERMDALGENQSLRNEILQYLKSSGQQQQIPQPQVEEINFDGNPDDLDLYDEGEQKKVRDFIKKVTTRKPATPSPEDQQKQTELQQQNTQKVNTARDKLLQSMIDNEFADIQSLQIHVPKLQTELDFRALNSLVDDTYKRIGMVAGNPAQYMNAVNTYLSDTPEGKTLRDRCDSQGIKLPKDYEKHQAILRLRGQRENDITNYLKNESERQGRKVERYEVGTLPNSSYSDYFVRSGGNPSNLIPTLPWMQQSGQQIQQLPADTPPQNTPQQPAPAPQIQSTGQQQQPNNNLQQAIQSHIQSGNQLAPAHATEIPIGVGNEQNKMAFQGMTEAQLLDTAVLAANNPSAVTPEVAKYVVSAFLTNGVPEENIPMKLLNRSKE